MSGRGRGAHVIALALAAWAGARPCGAHELVVLDGPPELRGLALSAVRPAFSRAAGGDADVPSAPLVLCDEPRTSAGCPRACAAAEADGFDGAIVIFASDDAFAAECSYEAYARHAGEALGALAVLRFEPHVAALDGAPGRLTHEWFIGDARELAWPVTADISQRAAEPLLAALRRGARVRARLGSAGADAVRAHAAATVSVWPDMWGSAWWWVYRLVLGLHALAVLELAAARVHDFARIDGGLHATTAQALLGCELALGGCRATLALAGPHGSSGALPASAGAMLEAVDPVLSATAYALFLVIIFSAAANSGLAVTPPEIQRPLMAVHTALLTLLALHLSLAAARAWTGLHAIWLAERVLTPLVDTSVVLAGLLVRHRLRGLLSSMPAALRVRLQRETCAALALSAASGAFGVALSAWGDAAPWRLFGTSLCAQLAKQLRSYVLVAAIKPAGVATLRGPLRLLWLRVLEEVTPCIGRAVVARRMTLRRGTLPGGTRVVPSRVSETSVASSAGPVQPHLLLGVSLRFLRGFAAAQRLAPADPTSVVASRVRELTKASRESICERCKHGSTGDGHRVVGRATLFVCHAQACSFLKLLDAVDAHLALHRIPESETYIWMDLFSIRQHEVTADVYQIGEIIRRVKRVLMVLDPWDAPICLTRVWCLYEVTHCVTTPGVQFHVTMAPEERSAFVLALRREREHVEQALTAFDARTAQTSFEADREMIFELIRSRFGGVEYAQLQEELGGAQQPREARRASRWAQRLPSLMSPTRRKPGKRGFGASDEGGAVVAAGGGGGSEGKASGSFGAVPLPGTVGGSAGGSAGTASVGAADMVSAATASMRASEGGEFGAPRANQRHRSAVSSELGAHAEVHAAAGARGSGGSGSGGSGSGEHSAPYAPLTANVPLGISAPEGSAGGSPESAAAALDPFDVFNGIVRAAFHRALAVSSWPMATPQGRRRLGADAAAQLSPPGGGGGRRAEGMPTLHWSPRQSCVQHSRYSAATLTSVASMASMVSGEAGGPAGSGACSPGARSCRCESISSCEPQRTSSALSLAVPGPLPPVHHRGRVDSTRSTSGALSSFGSQASMVRGRAPSSSVLPPLHPREGGGGGGGGAGPCRAAGGSGGASGPCSPSTAEAESARATATAEGRESEEEAHSGGACAANPSSPSAHGRYCLPVPAASPENCRRTPEPQPPLPMPPSSAGCLQVRTSSAVTSAGSFRRLLPRLPSSQLRSRTSSVCSLSGSCAADADAASSPTDGSPPRPAGAVRGVREAATSGTFCAMYGGDEIAAMIEQRVAPRGAEGGAAAEAAPADAAMLTRARAQAARRRTGLRISMSPERIRRARDARLAEIAAELADTPLEPGSVGGERGRPGRGSTDERGRPGRGSTDERGRPGRGSTEEPRGAAAAAAGGGASPLGSAPRTQPMQGRTNVLGIRVSRMTSSPTKRAHAQHEHQQHAAAAAAAASGDGTGSPPQRLSVCAAAIRRRSIAALSSSPPAGGAADVAPDAAQSRVRRKPSLTVPLAVEPPVAKPAQPAPRPPRGSAPPSSQRATPWVMGGAGAPSQQHTGATPPPPTDDENGRDEEEPPLFCASTYVSEPPTI